MKKKVLIIGPVLTQSGYGEHARFIYRALKSREDLFDLYVRPIKWGKTSWLWEDTEERRELDSTIIKTIMHDSQNGNYDVAMLVTIPNEWENYRIPARNIGVCAGIETSKVSPQWLEAANRFVDSIIVPSNFSKKIYKETTYQAQIPHINQVFNLELEKPIEVVNYPVKKHKNVDLDIKLDYNFNFLMVAQWSPRKNVEKALHWFVEEFKDQEVGLVLKINKSNNSITDRLFTERDLEAVLKNHPDRKCKVYCLHGYMNEDEMHSLYSHPQIKALLSLTHGEGYGLPLFEAAYCGLPVITHDWGGQTDFLTHKIKEKKGKIRNKSFYTKIDYDIMPVQPEAVWDSVVQADSMWAYPKENSVKSKLRDYQKNYQFAVSQAKKLQKIILKDFAEDKIYQKVIDHVETIEVQTDANSELTNTFQEFA